MCRPCSTRVVAGVHDGGDGRRAARPAPGPARKRAAPTPPHSTVITAGPLHGGITVEGGETGMRRFEPTRTGAEPWPGRRPRAGRVRRGPRRRRPARWPARRRRRGRRAGRRRRRPRGWCRRRRPRPARRAAWPRAAGSRSPRRARGRRATVGVASSTPRDGAVGHPVGQQHPARRPSRGRRADGGVDGRAIGAVGPASTQAQVGVLGGDEPERVDEAGQVLAGLDGCRGRGRTGRPSSPGKRRPGWPASRRGAGRPWCTTRTRSVPSSSRDLRRRRRPRACAPTRPGGDRRAAAPAEAAGRRRRRGRAGSGTSSRDTVTTLGSRVGGTT